MTQYPDGSNSVFSPEAPGWRGWVGIVLVGVLVAVQEVGRMIIPAHRDTTSRMRRLSSGVLIALGLVLVSAVAVILVDVAIKVVEAKNADYTVGSVVVSVPYDLDTRPVSSLDGGSSILPASLAAFDYRVGGLTGPDEGNWLAWCLAQRMTSGTSCGLAQAPQHVETAAYDGPSGTAQVTATLFADGAAAEAAVRDLMAYARSYSSVDSYAIGTGPVSYFGGWVNGRSTFTWSHGAWLYTVASDTSAATRDAVQSLPF